MTRVTTFPANASSAIPTDQVRLYSGRPDRLFATVGLVKELRYIVPSGKKAIITKIDAVNTNNFSDTALYFAIYDSTTTFRYIFNNKRLTFKDHISVNCWIPLAVGEGFGCGFNLIDTVEVAGDLHITVSGVVY